MTKAVTFEGIRPGVCYRPGHPTLADYNEAITDLLCARRQLKSGDQMGCAVCGDSGHAAQDGCHHDPLILARQWTAAESVWACWHCGFTATTAEEARAHFGPNEFHPAACQKLGLDAADLLERYAAFIRTVPSTDFELHPYLPEVDRVAAELRAHAQPGGAV